MFKLLKQIFVGGVVMVAASRFAAVLEKGIDQATDAVEKAKDKARERKAKK